MAEPIDIWLAGRVALAGHGREADQAALGCRGRVALGYLVVERWRPVAADEIAEAVWGSDLPSTWRAALRGVIARVRRALSDAGLDGARVLTSGLSGYQIHLPSGSTVDVEVAEQSVQAALAMSELDPTRACVEARRAVGILRGEFLAGSGGPWVERHQAEMTELHLRALEALSAAATACSDCPTALWAAEEAVALQPLRESAHLRVMAVHEAAGNRGAALRAYERCRRLLAEELGVAPAPDTESAFVQLLGQEPLAAGGRSAVQAIGNLPAPLTRFVGRQGERAHISGLLASTRLITLTGPGGVGKSRLGLEVASEVCATCPDGVWLIELAGLSEPRLLAAHVMSALGVPDPPGATAAEALVAHLSARRTFLLLDNCEHLVEACASLLDCLLKACAGLRVMATSREPLRVGGETVFTVAPLSTPPDGHPATLEALAGHDAVALFVDRAQSAAPGLDLGPFADAVAVICRRLDGVPLAIELAAARVRSLSVPDIACRLSDRFELLVEGPRTAPARHQTLRAALDWSYEALSGRERRLFAAVSVFAGSFRMDAAEAVSLQDCLPTVGGPAIVDVLGCLVDKSLVVADRSGPATRYRLLETIRQYGHEALVAGGTERHVRAAQLRWAATLAESAEGGLEGPDQPRWLQVLDAEHDNLRGALDWAAAHREGLCGPRTAASLWRYWEIRGLLSEGRDRLEAAIGADAPAPLLAKLLNAAGALAQGQDDLPAARQLYEQALNLRRGLGDRLGVAAALHGLGNVAVGENNLVGARAIFERNLAASRELGDPRMIAASLMNLGVVVQLLFVSGRTPAPEGAARAHALYLESLDRYRALGDKRGIAQSLENLGAVAPYRGDDEAAQAFLEESLVLRRELHDRSGIAASARFLGHLALKSRAYDAARCLHEECLAIESDLGNRLLMVADLASLAEIAEGEGNFAEAARLSAEGLGLSDHLDDTESALRLRANLNAITSRTRNSDRRRS